jgi:basic membrane protein A
LNAELVSASGEQLWVELLRVYEEPVVAAISPAEVSVAGNDLMRVALQGSISNYGSVVLRLVDGVTQTHFDSEMSVEQDGPTSVLVGRSAALHGSSVGTSLQVYLSLNGFSFTDTGFAVTLKASKKLKIGFMYVTSPTDFGWTFQHNVARLHLENKFYGQIETIYRTYVSEWGPNQCVVCAEEPGWNASLKLGMWNDEPANYFGTHESAELIHKWVEEEGVNFIIATSFYYHWDTYHMANRYPDVNFIHVGGWLTRPNMGQVFPKVYQARYLSGIAMAWYIKKNNLAKKVGYASAFPLGETVRHINAFKLGMEQVDPEIEIYLTWVFTWHDARRERIGASRLFAFYGVEGIAQHTDSREPQVVAQEYGKVGVGYNADMLLTVGDSVLTSPVLVWGGEYAHLVQKALDGEPLGNANLWRGADVDAWRLSDYSSKVPAEAKLQIAEEYDRLLRGEDDIFCKPNMVDNKGRLRNGPTNPAVNPVPWEADHLVPGTTCLTGSVVNQVCQEYVGYDCVDHWLLEGIHDSCGPSPSKPEGITSPDLDEGVCFLGGMDLPDVCPDGEHLTIRGCVLVSAGTYSRDEKEEPCSPGYVAPTPGATICDPCTAGSMASTAGAQSCELCQPGFFAEGWGLSECRACSRGEHASQLGMEACEKCPIGTFADVEGSADCTACPAGQTTLYPGSMDASACICAPNFYTMPDSSDCSACPEGSISELGSTDISDCKCGINTYRQGDRCVACPALASTKVLEGAAAGTLATGAENVLACKCETGFFMTGGDTCALCPDGMLCPEGAECKSDSCVTESLIHPLLMANYWSDQEQPLAVFSCGSTERCPAERSPGECAPNLQGRACAHCADGYEFDGRACVACPTQGSMAVLVFPILPILLSPILICVLYKISGDSYEKWGSWRQGLASIVFIGTNHYQIINLLHGVDLAFPPKVDRVYMFFKATNDVTAIFNPSCSGFADMQTKMIQKSLTPLAVAAVVSLTWGASQVATKAIPQLCMEINRTINVFLSLVFTFFAGIVAMALMLFKCSDNPMGKSTLSADRSILCYEGQWLDMLAIGIMAFLCWCVGFGGLFTYIVVVAPRQFQTVAFQRRWKFLFIKFRPDTHWWALVFMAKGFLLNLGFVLLDTGLGQLYWMMTLLSLYATIVMLIQPWRLAPTTIVDGAGHILLLLSCSALGWFIRKDLRPDEVVAMDGDMMDLVISFSLLIIPLCLGVIAHMIYSKREGRSSKAFASIADAMQRFAATEPSGQTACLENLGDWDYYFMEQASHVVHTELANFRCRLGISTSNLSSELPPLPETQSTPSRLEVV